MVETPGPCQVSPGNEQLHLKPLCVKRLQRYSAFGLVNLGGSFKIKVWIGRNNVHSLATLSGKPVHLHLAENQRWGSQGASAWEAKKIAVTFEGVVNIVVAGGGKVS